MIKEPIEIFKLLLEKYGYDLIYETRTLRKGTYVIVAPDKKSYEMINIEGKDDVVSPSLYKELVKMDYLSSLITMDKPVDAKKTIHSSNYMSLFVKKKNLDEEIIKKEDDNKNIYNAVNRYYPAIKSWVPMGDSKKKKDRERLKMYDLLGIKLMEINEEELERNKSWIEENILSLKENSEYKDGKAYAEDYLKIFFRDTEDRFINEYNRYSIPKMFNSNDYNVFVGDMLYGLPGDNMQLNANKPSLKQMTRKNYCPTLLLIEDALLQHKFFNYLNNFAVNGERVLYVDDEGFYTYDQIKERSRMFNGCLLKLKRGKTLNLEGFEVVMGYKPRQLSREFKFENILEVSEDKGTTVEYGVKKSLVEVYSLVDEIIFYRMLKTNMFNDDIKIKDSDLKRLLELTQGNMYNWFYRGKEKEGFMVLEKHFLGIIKSSICRGNFNKAKAQFNLLYSLILHYADGGNGMANTVKDVREQVIEKIDINCSKDVVQYLDSDEQYYYSVGQIFNFLQSMKNVTRVNQSEINKMLNSKNDARLKRELERLYRGYNYSKYMNSRRFKALYAMVLDYKPNNGKSDTTGLLAGYLSVSILRNDKKNSNESN